MRANDHKTRQSREASKSASAPSNSLRTQLKIPKSERDQLDKDLQAIAATALACDADCVVTDVGAWLPYAEEFEKLGVCLRLPISYSVTPKFL